MVVMVVMVIMVDLVIMVVMVMIIKVIMVVMVIMVIMVIKVIGTDRTTRKGQTGETSQIGQTDPTFKIDFPGNLCRAAFTILAMFKRYLPHVSADCLYLKSLKLVPKSITVSKRCSLTETPYQPSAVHRQIHESRSKTKSTEFPGCVDVEHVIN